MLRNILIASAGAALALASAAAAQTASRPEGSKPVPRSEVNVQARMSMHVNGLVVEELKALVPDEKTRAQMVLRMMLVAKQEAIGHSCASYEVDQRRMANVMLRTVRPATEPASDASKKVANLNEVLRKYNILLGAELSQFGYDPSGYCDYAKTLVKDLEEYSESDTILVLKRS
jgi:hypothetical protein